MGERGISQKKGVEIFLTVGSALELSILLMNWCSKCIREVQRAIILNVRMYVMTIKKEGYYCLKAFFGCYLSFDSEDLISTDETAIDLFLNRRDLVPLNKIPRM